MSIYVVQADRQVSRVSIGVAEPGIALKRALEIVRPNTSVSIRDASGRQLSISAFAASHRIGMHKG